MLVDFLSDFANGRRCSDGKQEAQGAVKSAETGAFEYVAFIDVVDIDKISEIRGRHNRE